MLHKKEIKYLLDIDSIIIELERIMDVHNSNYQEFSTNFISVRAVERNLMIIGEAVNKLLQMNPSITITSAKHMIGLRNIIVHSYDSVDPSVLWRIIIKDIPILKNEVKFLLNQS
jgi:uncharacterized protein with HEPN domain